MVQKYRESTWPFLCILAVLFIISAVAPRAWEKVARDSSADQLLAEAAAEKPPSAGDCTKHSGTPTLEATTANRLNVAISDSRVSKTPAIPAPSEPATASIGYLPVEPAGKVADQPLTGSPSVPSPESLAEQVVRLPPVTDSGVHRLPPPPLAGTPAVPEDVPVRMAKSPTPIRPLPDLQASPGSLPTLEPAPVVEEPSGSAESDQQAGVLWHRPERLFAQLEKLYDERQTGRWAREVARQLRRLGSALGRDTDEARVICRRLEEMCGEGDKLALQLDGSPLIHKFRGAQGALCRRLPIWQSLSWPGEPSSIGNDPPGTEQLSLALAKIDAITGSSAEGRAWREYLLLDALRALPEQTDTAQAVERRELARRILRRVAASRLTDEQQRFLKSQPLKTFGSQLRRLAAGPMDRARLLRRLESYEQTALPSDARLLADELSWLTISPIRQQRELGKRLAGHYRGTNLRIAITEASLNRLIPERDPEYQQFRDIVLGRPVRGQSLTETNLAVRLIPDPNRLLMALEVQGQIAALTSSTSGPATFNNTSQSIYLARKPMELDTEGLKLRPAEVYRVGNVTRLRSLRTDFDGIPLLGPLFQSVARSQHDQKRPQLRKEVKWKVATRAKQRIDDEADARLGKISRRLNQQLLDPLADMSLGPEMVNAKTTKKRLMMQLRVASNSQLSGHTPRPYAPSDSLASVQVHQSVINNILEQLELSGRTFTLAELRRRVADRLARPELLRAKLLRTNPRNDDVQITFARKDAVRVNCQDGLISLTLAVARLRKSHRQWRNFQVRVHYRPVVDGLSVKLVRDGVVELVGRRVRAGSQVALRGIFSRTFPEHRCRQLVPEPILNHPKMAELAVTQMVIDDGWIAVALGPKRDGSQTAIAKR